jgi:hypothetical protein
MSKDLKASRKVALLVWLKGEVEAEQPSEG